MPLLIKIQEIIIIPNFRMLHEIYNFFLKVYYQFVCVLPFVENLIFALVGNLAHFIVESLVNFVSKRLPT